MAAVMRKIGWAVLAVVLLALVALITWEPFAARAGAAAPTRAYEATISRDSFGVPYIRGRTDADVAFGSAVAHAEDDFSTLQDVLAMTRGRYGAIAGEQGAAVDYVLALLDARGTARAEYPKLSPEVRAVIEGYAAGLNDYAARHPGEVKLARLFPVDGEDVATGFALRQPFFFGLNGVIEPLVKDTPLRREHGPKLSPALSRVVPLPWGEDAALAGSNAFAIAPKRSGDRVTRLVSNSHQPWRGGVAWYELTIDSDEGWHFTGANFPGSPWPFLGHNDTLGWTNTVNRADLIDVYKLVLDETGTRYRLDERWLPLEKRDVLLRVRKGPLVLPIRRTVWRSVHGPVIVNKSGAFAIRYAGMGSLASMEQYYRLTHARDFAEWQAAMAMQGVPSTNFIYGDAAGNIAMVYNALMPDRRVKADWRGVLPGDRSDLIWQGPAPWSAVPKIVNPASGFVFNANNTPFVAAGPGSELDPKAFAPELGIELDTTNRARRAVKLMAATNPIGRAELEAIKYDTGYEREGYVAWMLDRIAALDVSDAPELANAQALLGGWDLNADGRGPADALAVMVLKDAMSASYNLKDAPDPRAELAEAVEHLTRWFGRIDPPLGDVIRIRQGPGPYRVDLPMDGGGDTLRAATTWDASPEDGRLLIKHGDSFIQFVEWPRDGRVRSQSIQPFGSATTRPNSPHFTDQARLFAAHRLKPVHFHRDDAARAAVRRYRVSNR